MRGSPLREPHLNEPAALPFARLRKVDLPQGGRRGFGERWPTMEADMPLTDAIRGIFQELSDRNAARRRRAGFTCGDCERSYRCNLDPDENCIARQEQIARGDWKVRRRARSLLYELNLGPRLR